MDLQDVRPDPAKEATRGRNKDRSCEKKRTRSSGVDDRNGRSRQRGRSAPNDGSRDGNGKKSHRHSRSRSRSIPYYRYYSEGSGSAKCELPAFPSMGQLTSWIDIAIGNVNTASRRRDDRVVRWLNNIVYNPTSFHKLKKVPQWAKLIDKTLATAMTAMISKAANAAQPMHHAQILERQVGRDRHRARKQGWAIRGQQIFWLFLRHYKTSDRLGHFYGICDLALVHWMGDDR